MPFLDKLKNVFSSGKETKKKSKLKTYYKQDVDPNEIWSIIGELGDGAFGKVYKAKQKLKPIEAALKQVEIKDEVELEEFSVEIEILSQCKHKNIVGLYEAYFHTNKLWMFIEFCGGGALDSIMVDLEKPLTEPQIQYVCRQMCEGLDFLHKCFVIHRDLKAGNVLLTSDGQVKLADFGVSAKNVSFRQTRDTFIGTPYWMAPEVILCETIKDDPYTFKADIWSLGITLIEFAEIQPPNHQLHPMRVLIKIQKAAPPTLQIPTKWSANFRDFIAKCLVKDPNARPMMDELLEHNFISGVISNESIVELLSEVKAEVYLEEEDLDDVMDDVLSVIIHDDESSSDSPDGTFLTDADLDTDSADLISYSRSEENIITAQDEETDSQDSPVAESCLETSPFNSSIKADENKPTSTVQPSSQIDLEPASNLSVLSELQPSMTKVATEDISDVQRLVPGEPMLEEPVVSASAAPDDVLSEQPASVICEASRQLLDMSLSQKFPIESSVADVEIENTSNRDEEEVAAKQTVAIHSTVELMPAESALHAVPMQSTTEAVPIQSPPMEAVPVEPTLETVPNKSPVELVLMDTLPVELPPSTAATVVMKPPVEAVLIPSIAETVSDTETVPAQSTMETIPNHSIIKSLPVQPEMLPDRISTDIVSDESTQNASLVEVDISTENQPTVELQCSPEEAMELPTTIEVDEDSSRRDEIVNDVVGDEQDVKDPEPVSFDNGVLPESLKLNGSDEMKPSFGLPIIGSNGNDLQFSNESLRTGNVLRDIKNDSNLKNFDKTSTENEERTIEISDGMFVGERLGNKDQGVFVGERLGNKDQSMVKVDAGASSINAGTVDEVSTVADLTEIRPASAPTVSADGTKSISLNDSLIVDGKSDSKECTGDHVLVGEDTAMKKDYQVVNERSSNGTEEEVVRDKTIHQRSPGDETEDVSEKSDTRLTCNIKGADTNGSCDIILENKAVLNREIEISCVKKVEPDSDAKQPVISGTEVSSIEAKQGANESKVEITGSTDEVGKEEAKESVVLRYKPNKSKVPPSNIAPHGEKLGESAKSKVADAEMDAARKKQIAADEEEQKKQFRTLTKTRKFVINGVVVTSQTSRVVLSGTENKKHQEHELWKADLRELKRLQMEENRLLQALDTKAKAALDELARKQESDMQVLCRNYEAELEALAKQHQRMLNKLVSSQNSEHKSLQKKVKLEQEKDLKNLHESLKQDTKLWKQGIEMLPKQMRKEAMAKRKEEKDIEYAEKERKFLEEQHEKSEATMKRLTDQHQEKIVLLDKQFLQQRHHVLQIQQSRVTQLEERHMEEKYMASKLQLQEKFILRRQLMMQRNSKEIEQMKRINHESQQKLMQSQALELRKLPKKLKSDTKTRQLMYKESLRISIAGVTPELEKEKMKQFEEKEKYRKKEEILRIEKKHKHQMEVLNNRNDKQLSELEEMHAEKQKMLSDHQDQKLLELEKAFESEREMWKSNLESRKQTLDEDCCKEIAEHDLFYSQDNGIFLRHPSQRSLTGSVKSGSLAGSVKSGSIRGSLVM